MRTVALLAGAALVAMFLSMAAMADFLKRNPDSRIGRCVDQAVTTCGNSARDAALAGAPTGSTFRPTPILDLDPEAPLPRDLRDLMVTPSLAITPVPVAESLTGENQEGSLLFGVGINSDAGATATPVNQQPDPPAAPLTVSFEDDADSATCCECGLLGKYLTVWLKSCAAAACPQLTSTVIQDDAVTPAAFNAYHRNESPNAGKSDKCCAGNCECCCMKKSGQSTKNSEPCCTPASCCEKSKECGARVEADLKAVVLEFKSDKNGTYLVGVSKSEDDSCPKPAMVVRSYPMAKLTKDEAEQLSCMICRMVAPETWQEVGGAGCVGYFAPGKVLVVRQTPQVHKEVQDFLTQLGEAMHVQASYEKESLQQCRHDQECDECCAAKCCSGQCCGGKCCADKCGNHPALAPCSKECGSEKNCCGDKCSLRGSTIELRFDTSGRLVELHCSGCQGACTGALQSTPVVRCSGCGDATMKVDKCGAVEGTGRPAEERRQTTGEESGVPTPEALIPEAFPELDHAQRDGNLPGHEPVCPYSSGCQRFSPYYGTQHIYTRPTQVVQASASVETSSSMADLSAIVIHMLFPWWPGQDNLMRPATDSGVDEDVHRDPSR